MTNKQIKNSNKTITHKDLAEFGKMLMSGIGEMFEKMDKRLGGVETDVSELKTDVSELKADVGELKVDVGELKTDVGELKTDVSKLKTDMSQVKTDIKVLKKDVREIKNNNASVIGELQDLRSDQVLLPHQISRNSNKIDNHELRISSLEETTPASL